MPRATQSGDRVSIKPARGLKYGIANSVLLSCAIWIAVAYLIWLI